MGDWLDNVARELARGASRRSALRRTGGGLAVLLFASTTPGETEARPILCGPNKQKCSKGQVCENDQCTCPGETVVCGKKCCAGRCCGGRCITTAKLQTDARNCGTCGNACRKGVKCVGGACQDQTGGCPSGQTRCSGACVDTQTNAAHCGGCDKPCAAGVSCVGGSCQDQGCPTGQTRCNNNCVDPNSSVDHCGGCGNGCQRGQVCANGTCQEGGQPICTPACTVGQTCCQVTAFASGCVNLQTDKDHCGECRNKCVLPGQTCQNGQCVGGCQPPNTVCGNATASVCCTPNETCVVNRETSGRCVPKCNGQPCIGNQFCCPKAGGGEVCTPRTTSNCTACGVPCPAGSTLCCGGQCVNHRTDAQHCGRCENPCGSGEICCDGDCRPSTQACTPDE